MSLVVFAWVWIGFGLLSGVALGLFFDRDTWLGGYASWPRRMLRLGHISFFGTGALVLGSGLTMNVLGVDMPWVGAIGLVAGAMAMPTVCALSAIDKRARHLFFIPVTALCSGTLFVTVNLAVA